MNQTSVSIKNTSGSDAWIILRHKNSNGLQSETWLARAGETVGALTASFDTDDDASDDSWWVYLGIVGGEIYTCGESISTEWKAYALTDADNGQAYTFEVSKESFTIITTSQRQTFAMASTRIDFLAPVTNVFVLMLENHSMDNLLGLSGIEGITEMKTSDYNTYGETQYPVSGGAPLTMSTDPGHEFPDVVQQLTNLAPGKWDIPVIKYPDIGALPAYAYSSGFASNYATATDESSPLPSPDHIGDIMKCFTPDQLPIMNQLANAFAPCSRWFSSLPGPTWPNRFFVHCASSGNLDCSPTSSQVEGWEEPWSRGFAPPNGSIFDMLSNRNMKFRIYHDSTTFGDSIYSDDKNAGGGIFGLGYLPQVTSLKGIHLAQTNSLLHFAADLQADYPYLYTFIEPHYGNIRTGTYQGGSSQHPKDDIKGGEALIKGVYESIRQSPLWDNSLLIVTYDEHGGFYDSVPPPAAVSPDDGSPGYNDPGTLNKFGFRFDRYGVRVPAIIVSPMVGAGQVDSTVYDHSSVLATLESLFGLMPLTNRDKEAANVLSAFTTTLRKDCPMTLSAVATAMADKVSEPTPADDITTDAKPLPENGNLVGALALLHKTEIDLSGGSEIEKAAIHARFRTIKTKGDAKQYAQDVMAKVNKEKDIWGKV